MTTSTLPFVSMRLISSLIVSVLFSPLALAGSGRVEVLAVGAPGEVFLDSFPTGKTAPVVLDGVAVGEHEIKLDYGCMTGSGRVLVEEGKLAQVNLKLNNSGGVGTARIRDLPSDAEIWVDDAPLTFVDGISELPCGAHRMLVEAAGYLPWQETVVVTTGKWTQVRPQLESRQVDEPSQARRPVYDEDSYDEDSYDEDSYVEDEFNARAEDFEFSDESGNEDNEYIDEFNERKRDSDYAPRTPDELSGLDGPSWLSRASDRTSLTKRVGLSTVMVGGGLAGFFVAINGVKENNEYIEEFNQLFFDEPTSEEAEQYKRDYIRPAALKAGLGGTGAVIGFGGAAGVMLFMDVNATYLRLGGRF